jgi:hypothetical protein
VVTEADRHTLLFFCRHTAQATRTCSRLVDSFEPSCWDDGGGGGDGRLRLALGESMSTAQETWNIGLHFHLLIRRLSGTDHQHGEGLFKEGNQAIMVV